MDTGTHSHDDDIESREESTAGVDTIADVAPGIGPKGVVDEKNVCTPKVTLKSSGHIASTDTLSGTEVDLGHAKGVVAKV